MNIFGLCRKSFPTVDEIFSAGLSQLHFIFPEELFTENCFFWEILKLFSFFRFQGKILLPVDKNFLAG